MATEDKIDVILMTGVTTGVNHVGQVQLFLDGYGEGKIEAVTGHQPVQKAKLQSLIKSNPDAVVVLYSAGGYYAPEAAAVMNDLSKLYIVEAWMGYGSVNSHRLARINGVIAKGMPSKNFQGANILDRNGKERYERGRGVVGSTLTPSGIDHFGSLTYAGTIIKSQNPLSPPEPETYTVTGEVIGVETSGTGENAVNTLEPLIGANCKVIRGRTSQVWDGSKDPGFPIGNPFDGTFSVDLPLEVGVYQFIFSFLGFEDFRKEYQILNTTETISLGLIQMEPIPTELETKIVTEVRYEFVGKVVDSETKKKISGATIIIPRTGELRDEENKVVLDESGKAVTTKEFFSQPSGDFNVVGFALLRSGSNYTNSEMDEIIQSGQQFPIDNFDFTVSATDYNSVTLCPVNLDGLVKKSVGVIELTPLKRNIEEEIMELQNFSPEQEKLIKNNTNKDFISKLFQKLLKQIKSLLMPVIVEMIASFGITQLQKLLDKKDLKFSDLSSQGITCPANIEELNKMIERKNKLTKQLNNLYNLINKINSFLNPLNKLVEVGDKAIPPIQIAMTAIAFIPSTTFTPIPSGAFAKLNDAVKLLIKSINIFKPKIIGGFFQLQFLLAELQKVLSLLSILDTLIATCAEEYAESSGGGESNETIINGQTLLGSNFQAVQDDISTLLAISTQEQSEQLSPIVTNINGFEMSVITMNSLAIGELNRRRAIAQDKFGVTVLQGEPSFSSNDQILIDELVFYIQQNDLKAE